MQNIIDVDENERIVIHGVPFTVQWGSPWAVPNGSK